MPPPNPILFLANLNGTLAFRDRVSGSGTLTASGALRYQPSENSRINWCYNSAFSSTTTGWIANSDGGASTISRVADGRFDGGYACEVVTTGANAYDGLSQVGSYITNSMGWTKSTGYVTISFDLVWVAGSVATLRTGLSAFSANGGYVGGWETSALTGLTIGQKKRFSVAAAPPGSGDTYAAEKGAIFFISTNAVTFRVSNIVVETVNTPNATYFDGSYAGCSWIDPRTGVLGSAHASPSCNQLTAWIEEGTTNYITNPRFESNVSDWFTYSDRAISRDTTRAYIGIASLKAEATATVGGQNYACSKTGISIPATGTYTASCMMLIPSNWSAGDVAVDIRGFGLVAGANLQNADLAKKGQWQRVSLTFAATSTTGEFHITTRSGFNTGQPVNITNVQLEQKGYATSICDGSLGTGYSWSGTAHASSSTRAVSYITATGAGKASLTTGAQITRIKAIGARPSFGNILRMGDDTVSPMSGQYISIYLDNISNKFSNQARSNGGTADVAKDIVVALGSGGSFYSDQNPTTVRAGLLGGTLSSTNRANYVVNAIQGSSIEIGTYSSGNNYPFNGYIGPVVMFSRRLTDTERTAYNARIDAFGDLWSLYEQQPGFLSRAQSSEPFSLLRANGPDVVFI